MTVTVESVVYVATLVVAVGTALKMMYSFKSKMEEPYGKLVARLDHHEDCLNRDDKRLRALEEGQLRVQEDCRQILLVQSVTLSHLRTGNNTGRMQEAEEDLNEYLIKRK